MREEKRLPVRKRAAVLQLSQTSSPRETALKLLSAVTFWKLMTKRVF